MNIIQIKGVVAGAGKTHLLIDAFIRSNLNKKLIITPTNKAKQEIIRRLIVDYGFDELKAISSVSTLRSFKRNYVQGKIEKTLDVESGEWIDKVATENTYVTVKSTRHETRKPYNIFVDEVSMISKCEMEDLIDNWCIQNLITAGDVNQFEPIGGYTAVVDAQGKIKIDDDGNPIACKDEGEEWLPEDSYTVCLNKSHRAKDEILNKVLSYIKQGQIIDAISELEVAHPSEDCMNLTTDWHIAYTNRKCDKLNSMYRNPQKWIALDTLPMWNICKSEIWYKGEVEDLHNRWIASYTGDSSWEEWFNRYFKPAYGLTAHKLQGSTIKEGKIFIHLDDILRGGVEEHYKLEEFAKLVQKFLYIAISRAVSCQQLSIYCFGSTMSDVVKVYANGARNEYETGVLETFQMLLDLESKMTPMQEVTGADLICDSADPEALKFVFDHLNRDESLPDWVTEKHEDEMSNRKIDYSNRKKKSCKYTDEYLSTFKTLTDLRKVTKAKSVIDKWKQLHQ